MAARAPATKSRSSARYSLLKDPSNQTPKQPLNLAEVVLMNTRVHHPFLLYGELRYIDAALPGSRRAARGLGLARASRSRMTPLVKLARTLRDHNQGVLAALNLGMRQDRLKGAHQQGEIHPTSRIWLPLRQRPDRDGLPPAAPASRSPPPHR